MTTISLYQASTPVFIKFLTNLAAIMKKAEQDAVTRKIDLDVFVNARLAPDMFPFKKQIQIATDAAKGAAARLSGQEIPSFPDTEATWEELQERINKTIDYLKTVPAEKIDGNETRDIVINYPDGRKFEFKGLEFLTNRALPNFFFHITTAYDILRHNGVQIGKADYLG
ncbi:MAG TPA: DUF1993 domain-containing protein [Alphaproteobacteria bacterium]